MNIDAGIRLDSFELIAYGLDDNIDLALPALLLAADEYPNLDANRYLAELDRLADLALTQEICIAADECDAARRLALFLGGQCGFTGNVRNYYDPKNSFLNDVLDRRVGIPITLSLVLIEVGRRLGLPMVGIGLPGHFVAGCQNEHGDTMLIDMFNGGVTVSHDECVSRLSAIGIAFDPAQHLKPVTSKVFLCRMLANLRAIYVRNSDVDRTIRVVERMTCLCADEAECYRYIGNRFLRNDRAIEAARCFKQYLHHQPHSEHSNEVRETLSDLLTKRALRN